MAKQGGAIARFLIKWLVIPVGLAAIGFFVVGPRLGAHINKVANEPKGVETKVEETAPAKSSRFTGEPEVEISARPISRRKAPRRSARRTPSPAPSVPESTPPGPGAVEPPPLDDEPPARPIGGN